MPSTEQHAPVYHPHPDEYGMPVPIHKPSKPSALSAWAHAHRLACVVPGGAMPESINGIPVTGWLDHPRDEASWEALAAQGHIEEPPFKAPAGLKAAAGVVIREPDGRVWVVAPTNRFAGYETTFPKGTLDGTSMQAAAIREAFEESGLKVRLIRFLTDSRRSLSYSRYYLAERVGGNPADMGWESQAVMLVPASELANVLNNQNDKTIAEKLIREDPCGNIK